MELESPQRFPLTAIIRENERDPSDVISTWGTQMGYDLATYMIKEFWLDLRKHHRRATAGDDPPPTPSAAQSLLPQTPATLHNP